MSRRSTNGAIRTATDRRPRTGSDSAVFDFVNDETGFSKVEWQHLVVEANRRVALGDGRITNVAGWREVWHQSLADIDATTEPIFHLFAFTEQRQVSNELRYSGWLRPGWEATLGVYIFSQDILYRERRIIRRAWGSSFGGDLKHVTGGVFLNNDIGLGDRWMLTLGARRTFEEKDVEVATPGKSVCDAVTHRCEYDFADGDSWRNVTPKVALQYWPGSQTLLYVQYTKGFRSGGYNLRNTSPVAPPGPFDEEEQDSFEAGMKSEFAQGSVRLNLAAFHNRVYGLQRQVTRADVATGGVQITANTADATIAGVEVDAVAALNDAWAFGAFIGYADGAYDAVRYDLNRDGATVGDQDLDLPRLANLTYGLDVRYSHRVAGLGRVSVRLGAGVCPPRAGPSRRRLGRVSVRVALAHRDDSEISVDNSGVLDGGDIVDASVSFSPSDSLTFTLYGRNLLNEVLRRSDFDLTGLVDSTYSPLKEGRILGLEVRGRL